MRWGALSLLVSLLLIVAEAQNGASSDAVAHVVFTKWANAPRGWVKYDTANMTADVQRWIRTASSPLLDRSFNFMFISPDATYVHSAPAAGAYVARIGVTERPNCSDRRLTRFYVNGVPSEAINVGSDCGCSKPVFIDVAFNVAENLLVTILIRRIPGFWPPAISNFELFPAALAPPPFECSQSSTSASPSPLTSAAASGSPSMSASPSRVAAMSTSPAASPAETPSPAATPSPSTQTTAKNVEIDIDVSASTVLPGTTPLSVSGSIDSSASQGLPPVSFATAREGAEFSFTFDLPPGLYNVFLGFIEPNDASCDLGARVFNVFINDNMRLESFDIFSSAGACRKAHVERFQQQTVDALDPKPFVISFQGIAGLAILSHLRIRPSGFQCTPVTTDADLTADHLAHAVAGEYPPNGAPAYVDGDGDGFVTVNVDGSGSHTHFSYNGKNGQITSYTWISPETGKVFASTQKFTSRFSLGTTRLRLQVIDDACSRDEAETSITVTGIMQNGQYCYYYSGLSELPMAGTLSDSPRPSFAAPSSSLNLGFPSFSFQNSAFVARCKFFVDFAAVTEGTVISATTGSSGIARVYKGTELVFDTETSLTAPTSTTVGLQEFEVIYQRTDLSKTPTLAFRVNGTVPAARYDQSTVLPVLSSVDPNNGKATGGDRIKLNGFGLYLPLTVSFGGANVSALEDGATARTIFVNTPPGTGAVDVRVTNNAGLQSNPVTYTYGSTCDAVSFTGTSIKTDAGEDVNLKLPTAVTMWQDGKLYVGTRGGIVQALGYDVTTLKVSSYCASVPLRDPRYNKPNGSPSERSILGITFDPRDKEPRPYVSASTLFWQRQGMIQYGHPRAWSNGAVERLRPVSSAALAANPSICLEFDRTIVQNLPVSDGDHSVNELLFTQNGDLVIAVGGNTNAGLPFAPLGGNWESYFSGSVVVARLSRPTFNGTIDYTTPENLRTAVPKSTDVDLYSTGVRNMFAMTMARSGQIYGADMGPNCRFGNASSTCSEYNETEAAERSTSDKVPFPGSAIVGPEGECKYGDTRKDKLLEIKAGKFYGHSNIQRALWTNKPGECGWIDPLTGRTGRPAQSPPPTNYQALMSIIQSPTTGIREYGSALFCNRLRGNLILSRYKSRGVWRVRLKTGGSELNGSPEMFDSLGGLRVEENAHGDLLFPKLEGLGVYVMRPKVSSRTGLMVANAVPFRHGRSGGTKIIIGGWGFESGVAAFIGGKACPIVKHSDTEITCTVPPFAGGSELVSVRVTVGSVENVLPGAVLYMSV